MAIDRWDFTFPEGEERRVNLEADTSFDAIAGEIRATMDVLCCHNDACDRGPFRRVVYCVKVAPALFDRFFNSRHGYRAAALGPEFMRESLTSLSGKAWLAEPNGFRDCTLCKATGQRAPRMRRSIMGGGSWERPCSPETAAPPPYRTQIKLMGTFLNDGHDEFIPARAPTALGHSRVGLVVKWRRWLQHWLSAFDEVVEADFDDT